MLDSEPGAQAINIRSITLPTVERAVVDLESLISPAVWEKFMQIAAQEHPSSPDAQITLTANVKAAFPGRTPLPVNENSLMQLKNWVSDAYALGQIEDCAGWLYDLLPLILGKQDPPKLKKLMETAILEKVNSRYYAVPELIKLTLCLRHLYPHLYNQLSRLTTIDELHRSIADMESATTPSVRNYASMMAMTRLYVGEAEWTKFKLNKQHLDSLKELIQLYSDRGNFHGIAEIAKNLAIISADSVSVDEQGMHIYRGPKQETNNTPLPVLKAA